MVLLDLEKEREKIIIDIYIFYLERRERAHLREINSGRIVNYLIT